MSVWPFRGTCTALAGFFAFAILGATSSAGWADLVTNGNFETVGPSGPNTTHSGSGGLGVAGAGNWFVWHNTPGSAETNWGTYDMFDLPVINGSQNPLTDHVLRVEASHSQNGLVQTWGSPGSGPASASGSIWVWVDGPGQVGVGIGNGGSTTYGAFTQTINQWELLTFGNVTSPVNEFIIYSNSGSAQFYVDFASASAIPEPASAGLGLLGMLAVIRYRRR